MMNEKSYIRFLFSGHRKGATAECTAGSEKGGEVWKKFHDAIKKNVIL